MARPKIDPAAREAELLPRRDVLRAVGTALHGARWISPLADDLARVAERQVLRGTVAQWDALHRPVPDWAGDALRTLAREGAARLRERADALDAACADPAAPEPEEPPQAAEEAAPYDPFEEFADLNPPAPPSRTTSPVEDDAAVDAIHDWMASLPAPEPARAPEPPRPPAPTGWTSRAAEEAMGVYR